MNRIDSMTRPLAGFMALLLAVLVAGCGGGSDPILGGGGAAAPATLTDKTRPRVSVTVPANAGTLAANSSITAVFNESMAPATVIAAATFTVMETVSGTNVPGAAVTYSAGSRTAVFKPTAALTPALGYTATITTAATDLAGNALAGNQAALPAASNYVWTFTAAAVDAVSPTVTLESPADLATAVPLNSTVNATFSEAMDQATISTTTFTLQTTSPLGPVLAGAVTYDAVNNIAILTPSVNLAGSTQYTATVTTGAMDLAGNALAAGVLPNPWTFTTGTALAPGSIALGSAGTFGIMATSAITSTGASIINGDVSLDPGTSMTGFPPAIVNGEIHINDTVSEQARLDLLSAYNSAKSLPPGTTISAGADLGALYLSGIPPGTYTSGSTMLVATPLTLDAGGNANAVWVFQVGSSFTTTASVTLANGAQSKNVFWVPTSDGTIGVGTIFEGTIVAGRDVTAVTGATINGRILAGAITAGTIALQSSTVNVPAP
ncbi:MAG: ice-binding family protein [Sideroxyarcus sp.]|nr:ice-binding family protein [Sideroxyarcus sp.]